MANKEDTVDTPPPTRKSTLAAVGASFFFVVLFFISPALYVSSSLDCRQVTPTRCWLHHHKSKEEQLFEVLNVGKGLISVLRQSFDWLPSQVNRLK